MKNITQHTENMVIPAPTRKIVDMTNIQVDDCGIATHYGPVNRDNWKVQAIQLRCHVVPYKPGFIYREVVKYGYKGSKPTFDNFLRDFKKICDITYPDYERVGDVKLSELHQVVLKPTSGFWADNDFEDDGFYGEPSDIFGDEQFDNNNFKSYINAGKIHGDGTETDLMFKDYGVVPDLFDDELQTEFTAGEIRLLNKIR